MKKLFAALKRAPKRTSALIAVVLGVVLIPAALFAYGPGRPTYTMEHPADHVTFDSITDNPTYGDEREFVTIKDATTGGSMTNKANLVPGHTYLVQMYVHNDASSTLNDAAHNYKGVARNTTIRAVLPTSVDGNDTVDGFISASNATPETVYDTAALTSNGRVNLEYVQGSAKLHTWKQQTALSANMFGNGTPIGSGDQSGTDLSGNWNGCIDYAGTVTYEFKVTQPAAPNFSVEKMVSKHGANSWSKNYTAQPGETVDFRIKYANTGNVAQDNVVVKDSLPTGLSYVNGTTRLYNSETPAEGKLLSDNVTKGGVNIGNYAPAAWAYVAFSAKVADNDSLPTCGTNTLTNTATVETDSGSKSDTATVTVNKTCETPQAVYTCNALTITKVSDTQYKFATAYTVKNATYRSTNYVVKDANSKQVYSGPNTTFTETTPGTYTVRSTITVDVSGSTKTATSEGCTGTFTVPTPPGQIQVCRLSDHQIVTINENDYDSSKYSKDLSQCQKVTVCDTTTGKTVQVYPSQIDNERYTTDMTKCTPVTPPVTPPTTPPAPTTPVELPHTGASDVIMSVFGAGSLIAAVSYYVASRRALS